MLRRPRPRRAGCWYENDGNRVCNSAGNAYATTVYAHNNDSSVTVGPSWTRGLAIHPVGTSSVPRARV